MTNVSSNTFRRREKMNEIKIRDMTALAEHTDYLRKKPKLTYLFFELTNTCNLACKHCGSSCKATNKTFLPYEDVVGVIDMVADNYVPGEIMICLTGGEPMMHPDFYSIASYAKSKGFSCGITTNGTMITKEAAKRIIDSGIESVMFSLDGLEKNHNWLRGSKTAFQDTVNGIKNLKDLNAQDCVIAATTVVHKKNISELNLLYDYIDRLGLDIWRLVNIEPIGRAETSEDLMLKKEDYKFLLDFIKEKRFAKDKNMDVTFGCSHYTSLEYERMTRDTYFMCGSGIYVASILCNGDIYSCLDIERREELVQGSIYTDNFIDVWENRFEIFRQDRSAMCKECSECSDRVFCQGDSTHTWDFNKNLPKICLKKLLNEERE